MLTFYGHGERGPVAVAAEVGEPPAAVDWIDALEPSLAEMAWLGQCMKVRVPTVEDLAEIESSSRLSVDGDTLLMSLPVTIKDETGYPKTTSIGFIVSKDRVATLRFTALTSFDKLAKQVAIKGEISSGGMGATISILEVIVDHLADILERTGEDLDAMSRTVFSGQMIAGKSRPHQSNQTLKRLLQNVGRDGDLISKVSETLLGLSRITPFLGTKGATLVTPDLKTRLESISQDTRSLHDYQEHVASKTQFLLDALLGLANIEQNNVFRVLTIVSVIGIPPTFFASMYGMNFKTMPEYDWAHGYAYGLTLIACSAILPAVWFKLKGWW